MTKNKKCNIAMHGQKGLFSLYTNYNLYILLCAYAQISANYVCDI
jgi:hypothetical protein